MMNLARLAISSCRLSICRPAFRHNSSSSNGKCTELIEEKNLCVLMMNSAPANTMSSEFMIEMIDRIGQVESQPDFHGLILASSVKNIFSSGLDLHELVNTSQTSTVATKKFYNLLLDLWFQLYKSRLVTIAAMNGHAIAGGCAIALPCDYRILTEGDFLYGIPSINLGLPVPVFFHDALQRSTTWHKGSIAALQAKLYSPDEALKHGFVDKVVPMDRVIEEAKLEMTTFLRTNHKARVMTKMDLRADLISKFGQLRKQDSENLVKFFLEPDTLKRTVGVLESLKTTEKLE